jgi:Uma2 family endonuclease
MIDKGILKEDERIELIRGEIVAKMPIGDPHIDCVNCLTQLFVRAVANHVTVSIQNPVRLADSEPEPDVVLKRSGTRGKPSPADILLLIEVAESSLEYDRDVKGPLYAEAGIGEYWIVNIIENCVEVYRDPRPDGTFGDMRTYRVGERIELLALSGMVVAVAEVLGT